MALREENYTNVGGPDQRTTFITAQEVSDLTDPA